jgi:hypothetical protein
MPGLPGGDPVVLHADLAGGGHLGQIDRDPSPVAANVERDEAELAAIIEAEQNQAEAASLRTIGKS